MCHTPHIFLPTAPCPAVETLQVLGVPRGKVFQKSRQMLALLKSVSHIPVRIKVSVNVKLLILQGCTCIARASFKDPLLHCPAPHAYTMLTLVCSLGAESIAHFSIKFRPVSLQMPIWKIFWEMLGCYKQCTLRVCVFGGLGARGRWRGRVPLGAGQLPGAGHAASCSAAAPHQGLVQARDRALHHPGQSSLIGLLQYARCLMV